MGEQAARVEVFIDYSNMYVGARELFGRMSAHWVAKPGATTPAPTGLNPDFGHFDPRKLALILAARTPPGRGSRELTAVHVFRGEPDRGRSPQLWAHFRRAVDRWEADGVHVTALPCRYRRHADRMIEKGVDVALALEAFDRATRQHHDVAIVVSADQDLLPLVTLLAGDSVDTAVEVAAWAGEGYGQPAILDVPGVVEHRISREVFEQLRVSNWMAPALDSHRRTGEPRITPRETRLPSP